MPVINRWMPLHLTVNLLNTFADCLEAVVIDVCSTDGTRCANEDGPNRTSTGLPACCGATRRRGHSLQLQNAVISVRKLREAMAAEVQTGEVLEGHVEIDGAYFGGHIRPANAKIDRVDRRLKRHQTGKRRVVIALREREGRVLPFVGESEYACSARRGKC